MKALIGTRKAAILVRLAIALALIGSIDHARATSKLAVDNDLCFLIDGQIYCIPGTGGAASGIHAELEILQPGIRDARQEDVPLGIERSQRGEATAARHGRPV